MALKTSLAGLAAAALGCAIALAMPLAARAQMPPDHAPSPALLAAEGVRTSANIARGAADICHIDAAKIERFKAAARANFPAAPDFDGAWNLGYSEASATVERFAKLKATNPAEYAKEIHEACPALDRGIDEVTRPQ
jgi:hypothetical protein